MTTTTSRRAILAGAAALPALAMPAIASATVDPIFALIEAHRVAFPRRLEAQRATGEIPLLEDPDCGEADRALHAADDEAFEADMNAAFALVTVPPTTMAGVLALIDYVDNFNRGKFKLNDDWYSADYMWSNAGRFDWDDEYLDKIECRCGMEFAILLNVRAALESLAVQS